MGSQYLCGTYAGATPGDALEALRARFRADGYTAGETICGDGWEVIAQSWPDPFRKSVVRVWGKPVKPFAADWMRGWIGQHPPEGVDPDDKWGPWMAFPLAERGQRHLFGWVNT